MLTYTPKLIDELTRLNSKLEIEIDEEDKIAAVEHDQLYPGEKFDYSMMFWHDKGKIECGMNLPTRKEFYFDKNQFDGLSYHQKKGILFEKLGNDYRGDYEDDPSYNIEFPWVSFDDQGHVDQKTNTEKSMNDWLKESTDWEDHEGDLEQITRYLPGIEIYEFLPEEDKLKYLNDLGMAHTMPGITFQDEMGLEFDKIIDKYNLPFYFKD